DPGPEPERVRNGLRRAAPARFRLLAQTGAERPVDDLLERQPELVRLPLQQPRQIVIDRQGGTHAMHHDAKKYDVKTSIPDRAMHWCLQTRVHLIDLSKAGLTGVALSPVNYVDELPFFCDDVLPRHECAGLREKR